MDLLARIGKEWEADWRPQAMALGLVKASLSGQAKHKFGSGVADDLGRRLYGVLDMEQLALVGDWIIDCDTGEALLARVEDLEATAA